MTDKEKAEEYAIKITDELKNKGCISYEEINQRYAGIIQGYEYGYKAGKKHEADKIFDEWCSGTHDYPQKCEFLKKLEKENAEIKEMSENRYKEIGKMGTKINTLTFENRELKGKVKTLEDIRGTLNYVIEYQKRKIHALEYLIEGIKESIQEFEEEEKEEEEEEA